MLITPTRARVDETLVIPELQEWVDLYLADCQQQLFKTATVVHYDNALKRFALWYNTQIPGARSTAAKPNTLPIGWPTSNNALMITLAVLRKRPAYRRRLYAGRLGWYVPFWGGSTMKPT